MTLYTTMPLELVLQGMNAEYTNLTEVELQGRVMLVERISLTEVRVERLVQAVHLDDYLNTAYAPGTIISIS